MSPETVKVLGMCVGDIRPLTTEAEEQFELEVNPKVFLYSFGLEGADVTTPCGKVYEWYDGLIKRIK